MHSLPSMLLRVELALIRNNKKKQFGVYVHLEPVQLK